MCEELVSREGAKKTEVRTICGKCPPIKVSDLSDEELSDAILYCHENPRWIGMDWLLPENWTRLLEELHKKNYGLRINGRLLANVNAESAHGYYENDRWSVEAYRYDIVNIESKADTLDRAVCEVYAIAFGGGKYV